MHFVLIRKTKPCTSSISLFSIHEVQLISLRSLGAPAPPFQLLLSATPIFRSPERSRGCCWPLDGPQPFAGSSLSLSFSAISNLRGAFFHPRILSLKRKRSLLPPLPLSCIAPLFLGFLDAPCRHIKHCMIRPHGSSKVPSSQ